MKEVKTIFYKTFTGENISDKEDAIAREYGLLLGVADVLKQHCENTSCKECSLYSKEENCIFPN